MAKVYFITGSLGSGKTLAAITMVRDYLQQGRRVATNVNLNLEYLCNDENKHSRVIRVPDAPEINDLRAIGFGSQESKDETHGLLLLDELGTWFNSRDFASKGRLEVVKWMIHMRKRRWDVVFIVQDFSMVDKQARGNIAQYLVTCQNSKTMWLFKPLPKFHTATVRMTATKMITDRWIYKGADVYNAYDTEQLFHTGGDDGIVDSDAEMSAAEKKSKALNGLYCVLPPGYYGDDEKQVIRERFRKVNRFRSIVVASVAASLVVAAVFFFLPPPQIAQADIAADPAAPSDPSLLSAPPAQVEPPEPVGALRYEGWRITGMSYIGGKFTHVQLTNGVNVESLDDVIARGMTVRHVRGRAMAISDPSGVFVVLKFH